jgi:phosphatidylserine decarboxylase
MPIAGKLEQMLHIPGRLFGVSSPMVRHIPRLFARNERVVCVFESAAGPLAMILVGAIGVGSIETDWAGEITPPRGRRIRAWSYTHSMPLYSAGEEMGRFNLGSAITGHLHPATGRLRHCPNRRRAPRRLTLTPRRA